MAFSARRTRKEQALNNFKARTSSWIYAFASLSVALTSYFFVQAVLINHAPPPNFLQLSPGHTILSVNIFAHVVAFLVWDQVSTSLEALRWALASRPEQGLSLGSFLALSRAVGPTGVISLMLLPRSGGQLFYCLKRLSFMGLAWVLGIVLTSNVDFKVIYTPTGQPDVEVYAGLAPLSIDLLPILADHEIVSFYYSAFEYSLLSDNRYSLPIQPIKCNGPTCFSYFLPGGAAWIAHQDGSGMLFNGSSYKWDEKQAVITPHVPGYHLEFYPPPDAWKPDPIHDCKAYWEMYVCVANYEASLIVGWSVCPSSIYDQKSCFNNTSWQHKLDQTTVLAARRRFATVAYSGANFSILSLEQISDPDGDIFLDAKLAEAAISGILTSASHSNETSLVPQPTIRHTLASGLRFYGWLYPDRAPPLDILHNFIAVPFQCATGIRQILGSIPDELKTNATVVTPLYRAIADPWVLRVYGAIALILSLWSMAALSLACILSHETPSASKFPEVDLISRFPSEPSIEGDETSNLLDKTGKGSNKANFKEGIKDLGHLSPINDNNKRGLWGKILGFVGIYDVLQLINNKWVLFGLPDDVGLNGGDGKEARVFIRERSG